MIGSELGIAEKTNMERLEHTLNGDFHCILIKIENGIIKGK